MRLLRLPLHPHLQIPPCLRIHHLRLLQRLPLSFVRSRSLSSYHLEPGRLLPPRHLSSQFSPRSLHYLQYSWFHRLHQEYRILLRSFDSYAFLALREKSFSIQANHRRRIHLLSWQCLLRQLQLNFRGLTHVWGRGHCE